MQFLHEIMDFTKQSAHTAINFLKSNNNKKQLKKVSSDFIRRPSVSVQVHLTVNTKN